MRDYILFILIGLIFISFIIYSEQTTSFDAQIGEYEIIRERIEILKKENIYLKEEIYTLSSYTYIASMAAQMGYINGEFIFIR